jgi:Siphovirus Gp157
MLMEADLAQRLGEYENLRGWLHSQFPNADDDALRDTLEGLSNLPQTLASILRSHLDDLALLAALRTRILDMQERFARLEIRADKKRALVASVMERADIKKLTEPDFTASLRQVPPSLVVVDEHAIPEPFWRSQPPKLDRKGLLAALNAGQTVPGASLGNGSTTIAVRTR